MGKVVRVGNSEAVVIPANIRRALHIQRGDRVVFTVHSENEVVVRKVTPDEIRRLRIPDINI